MSVDIFDGFKKRPLRSGLKSLMLLPAAKDLVLGRPPVNGGKGTLHQLGTEFSKAESKCRSPGAAIFFCDCAAELTGMDLLCNAQ